MIRVIGWWLDTKDSKPRASGDDPFRGIIADDYLE